MFLINIIKRVLKLEKNINSASGNLDNKIPDSTPEISSKEVYDSISYTLKNLKKEFLKNDNYDPGEFKSVDSALAKLSDALVESFLVSNGYLSKLALKKSQLSYVDHYGDTIDSDWKREIKSFANTKYLGLQDFSYKKTLRTLIKYCRDNDLSSYVFQTSKPDIELICDAIEWHVESYLIDNDSYDEDNDVDETITPEKFEKFVAMHLKKLGWDSRVTKLTGDQGADVVAEKNNIRMVVQCKLYSQPVGNDAVQQVFSAKSFYDADVAIVISNADYTKSARQLSESNGVILLHYTQLEDFDEIIFS